jgi:ubiquinone/menaquinone biosynthesis C-methylase UbiE
VPNRQRALQLYRRPHATTYPAALHALAHRATALLRVQPGDVVLDVGCGTGRSFPLIQPALGTQGQLIGIDQSPAMLAKARQRVEAAGWENVTLIQAAAEEAELAVLADAALFLCTYDAVSSPLALGNVLRHLKAGGRIVAAGPTWSPWWAVGANLWTWYAARRYVSSLRGYGRPWTSLAGLVPGLQVEFVAISSLVRRRGYVAWGALPG